MADPTGRSGGNSLFWFGEQDGQSTPNASTAIVGSGKGPTNTKAASARGKINNRRLPFTGLGLDLASEQAESRSIVGRDASSKRAGGQLWCEGSGSFEILPLDLIFLLRPFYGKLDASAAALTSSFYFKTTAENAFSGGNTAEFTATTEKLTPTNALSFEMPAKITDIPDLTAAVDTEITIKGRRRIGVPSDETVVVTEIVKIKTADTFPETEHYWADIDEITLGTGVSITAGSKNVTFDTDTYKTQIRGFEGSIQPCTVFQSRGGVPEVARDVAWNTLNLSVADVITAEIGMIGGRFDIYRSPVHNEAYSFETGKTPDLTGWLNETAYPVSDLDFSPSWGVVLEYAGRTVPCVSLDLGINLNLESRAGYTGSRYRSLPKKSATPRQVNVSPTVFFEGIDEADATFRDWRDVYISNAGNTPLNVYMYNYLDNGKQYLVEYNVHGGQLIEVPNPEVSDPSEIEETLNFLCLPDKSQTNYSNELAVNFYTGEPYY